MNLKMQIWTVTVGAILLVSTANAQNPFFGPDQAAGVQAVNGNTSPAQGFSTGETNSRIDDYVNQDEQINIDPNAGVIKVLRVNQKNLINDYVTAVFPIRHANPREIRDVFRLITSKEGGRAEVIIDKVKKENFLQVICPKFQVEWIRQALEGLDADWVLQGRDGSTTGVYYTQYRPADTLDVFAANYAGEGSTAVDRFRNTLARRDEPYRTEAYLKACAEFDQPPPQALLKFRVYEVDTSNDLKLGVDWIAWKNGPGRSLFEAIFAGHEANHHFKNATGFFDPNLGAGAIISPGKHTIDSDSNQYLLSANYLLTSAYLDFLRVKGKARALAEPELFVFSNNTATWTSSDQFLSFDVNPDDPGAAGLTPARIDFGSDFSVHDDVTLNHNTGAGTNHLGITLKVKPVIGTESSEVAIELEVTDLIGETPQGTPIVSSRRLVTKLRLVDGQPFVFGGLTREEEIDSSQKAPVLGDIPVLGYLFGQETDSARRKELVFTCIPRFFQGAPKVVEDPEYIDTISKVTKRNCELEVPSNCFGWDQLIFGVTEHHSPDEDPGCAEVKRTETFVEEGFAPPPVEQK